MIFITDRTWEDVLKVKQGATDTDTLNRGTLRPSDFNRWKEALETITPELSLPVISYDTLINCTNPTESLVGVPSGPYVKPINDCWYYWKAISDLRDKLPDDSGIDLTHFPPNMDNLTFINVNTLELVIEYFYNVLNI